MSRAKGLEKRLRFNLRSGCDARNEGNGNREKRRKRELVERNYFYPSLKIESTHENKLSHPDTRESYGKQNGLKKSQRDRDSMIGIETVRQSYPL